MSAHVLLNLLIKLRKSDKMQGLPSILSLFATSFTFTAGNKNGRQNRLKIEKLPFWAKFKAFGD